MVAANDFFDESTEQSRIKAAIVKAYFWAWARIMLKKQLGRIAYADLFAGPGKYKDGTKSTPLLVLEEAIADPEMQARLVTIFNDADERSADNLRAEIQKLEGIQKLKHQPVIDSGEVGDETVQSLLKMNLVPTLLFLDPFGYKGLSIALIASIFKNWGCDCIFFFNFNRINPGLSNESVKEHMDALFGPARAGRLRAQLGGLPPRERELAIIDSLCDALAEIGTKYVLPFCFKDDRGARTSHYLVFASKHPVGYGIMKDIMAKVSSEQHQGVASFGYCPASALHPTLFELSRPLDDLEGMLLRDFAGQILTMQEIYERHNVRRPYTSRNYKVVLRKMEERGIVKTEPPLEKRPRGTFANHVRVTFPKDPPMES